MKTKSIVDLSFVQGEDDEADRSKVQQEPFLRLLILV